MHKFIFRIGIAVVALVVAGGTAAAADGQAQTGNQTVVVKSGDSLSTIARALGLPSWLPLWNANPTIARPDRIYPGQVLQVPGTPAPDRPLPTGAIVQASSVKVTANYASGVGGILERVRMRESGGNYAINTGNGYYGAYQFDLATWRSVGGTGLPSAASPSEQDMRAQLLYARRGCQPWPHTCY